MAKKPKPADNGILTALRFVMGAVARKDYEPNLCHLLIKDGTVTATDGTLTAVAPIDLDITAKPHAKDMLKAILACDEGDVMGISYLPATDRLSIKAGSFRSFVKCLPDTDTMFAAPADGDSAPVAKELIEAISVVRPFMGVDASRTWALGVRIAPNVVYATNNVVLIQAWHGLQVPHDVIVPSIAVDELLRQKMEPTLVQIGEKSLTVWYGEKYRITTQLVLGQWPEQTDRIFDTGGDVQAIPEGFFASVEKILPFCEQKVYFTENALVTHLAEGEGTIVETDMPADHGCFYAKQLLELSGVASAADFTQHPRPCPFRGNKLRGVILGPRQ